MHYFDVTNFPEPVALVSHPMFHHRAKYHVPVRWIKDVRSAPPRTVFSCFHSHDLTENPDWTDFTKLKNKGCVSNIVIYKITPTPKSESLVVDDEEESEEEFKKPTSLQYQLEQTIRDSMVTSSSSLAAQITSLKNIVKILTNHYLPSPAVKETRNDKTLDLKILKKLIKLTENCLVYNDGDYNNDEKSSLIAQLIILLMTFQPDNEEDIMESLFSRLLSQALNNENPLNLRTTSVIYLAIIKSFGDQYDNEDNTLELETLLSKLELIFFDSLNTKLKELDDFQCGIFTAWVSIAILIPLDNLFYRFAKHGSLMDILYKDGDDASDRNDIDEIIESLSLNVRFKMAEVIGILLEYARTENEDFLEEFLKNIFQKLLSKNKIQYYKIRQMKTKQHDFSDIEDFIINNKLPKKSLSFGRDVSDLESINIGSLKICNKYKLLCNIFGNQTKIHLEQTKFVRDIFELDNVKAAPILGYPSVSTRDKRAKYLYVSKRQTVMRKYDRESKYYQNVEFDDEK